MFEIDLRMNTAKIQTPVLECVPNFSEGRDRQVIDAIAQEIKTVPGARLLHVDSGYDANRTVMTFAGEPGAVTEAAFCAIRKAAELIDMRHQKGAHPRLGATDVCPLVPVSGISMEQTIRLSEQLAEKVGNELQIPVYLYEKSARVPRRQNLAECRKGEYEGLAQKLSDPLWLPDYGPARLNAEAGATVIGARSFLIAYNINIDASTDISAKIIAAQIRESGYYLRQGDFLSGPLVRDSNNQPIRVEGAFHAVKALGWMMPQYGRAQVSTNLVDYHQTALHQVFEQVKKLSHALGVKVTGSELIGLIPEEALLMAGRFYAGEAGLHLSGDRLLNLAVEHLGLNELSPFVLNHRILEKVLSESSDFL